MSHYTNAQVCLNGHAITSDVSNADFMEKFCSQCGEPTITNCPGCNTPIRGIYEMENVLDFSEYTPPAYCYNCGNPFPWTKRALAAACELIDGMEELEPNEREKFKNSLTEVSQNTPKATVSANHIAKYIKRTAPTMQEAFKSVMYDITAKVAKRLIWPM